MNRAPRGGSWLARTVTARLRRGLSARPARYGLVGLFAAYVLWASVVDPAAAGGGGGLPPRGPLGLVGADKWLHAATYATMGFGAAYALLARSVRTLAVAALAATAFGAGVEVVQAPLAARSADLADAAANGAGALLGAGFWGLVGVVVDRLRGEAGVGAGDG